MKLTKGVFTLLILLCAVCVPGCETHTLNTSNNDYTPILKRLATNVQDDWAITAVNLSEKTKSISSSSITVALIDTGTNIKDNYILNGKNMVDNSNNMNDNIMHGTYICSIIHKVSPNVKILPIKVMDNDNQQKSEIISSAIQYAIDNKVDVINISLCMNGIDTDIQELLSKAYDLGIPVVCSAGNDNDNVMGFPANQDTVISCIARNINNVDVRFSNKSYKRSFSAPGINVLAENQYISGTSFATAYISGAISLMKSKDKNINVDNIISVLSSTASDGNCYSYGLINIDDAINKIINT